MRQFMLSFGLLLFVANVGRADPFTLDDIQLWVGTGSNRAGLIVDFKTGSGNQSFAWGFRWNGTATGADMVNAIAAANNAGLRATIQHFSFGDAVDGFGFDQNRDGQFSVTPTLNFDHGIATDFEGERVGVADKIGEVEGFVLLHGLYRSAGGDAPHQRDRGKCGSSGAPVLLEIPRR